METYVAWNVHEPREGEFRFDGEYDIAHFVRLAAELGLYVIVRPGPYVCTEWDLGGLPSWLLSYPGLRLRCHDPVYLEKVDRYFDALLPRLTPLLSTNGGPIIAMQIENEYGSYGNDKIYLRHLRDGMRSRGIDVLLFTSDGDLDSMLTGGTLEGVHKTVNFGSRVEHNFGALRKHMPEGPLMCSEYWDGWFDHWGEERHRRDGKDAAAVLDEILSCGGSANIYVFAGGTNFGFMSGCNCFDKLEPIQTSYDFDAPISECGDLTDKYYEIKKVVEKHLGKAPEASFPPVAKKAYGKVTLTESADLFSNLDNLARPVFSPYPSNMEALGQDYGFILYRTYIEGPVEEQPLLIREVHDRAMVFLDGEYKGTVQRDEEAPEIKVGAPAGHRARLDILVENMGRINYGPWLEDRKGITDRVALNILSLYPQTLFGWEIYCLPLRDLSGLVYQQGKEQMPNKPAFQRGSFVVQECAATFVDMSGFTKGNVFINGKNIGRYWEKGPQKTLYVPGCFLKEGENSIVVFELHAGKPSLEFKDQPDLG